MKKHNAIFTRVISKSLTAPVLTSFVVFLSLAGAVCGFSVYKGFYNDKDFVLNVVSEAHGTLLDLLIVGCLILWLNKVGERRMEIRRWNEQIDDFRFWKSDEAVIRTVGVVRRLNRLNITKIDLHSSYLKDARLEKCSLYNANLIEADLEGAILESANLENAVLIGANIWNTDLTGACLRGACLERSGLQKSCFDFADLSGATMYLAVLFQSQFRQAKLQNAQFQEADLTECDLCEADLKGANFENANLTKAVLAEADLKGANLRNATLREADLERSNVTLDQLSTAKTLYMAHLPPGLHKEISSKWPQLLVCPKAEDGDGDGE